MASPSSKPRQGSRDLFLGVDGGGTKTLTMLLSRDRKPLTKVLSGPSNPMRTGLGRAATLVLESALAACDRIDRTTDGIVSVVVGLAGVRREDLRREMKRLISAGLPRSRVRVVTDAEIALYAATRGKPGIVVISGTGSIVFGRNSEGETAVAGGWGPIAGDEGGGISIARAALQAVAKASDGRGPDTSLSKLAAEYFRSSTAEDLIVAIYSPQMDYTRLAGFARPVALAALEGDTVANRIIDNAARELGIAVCAVVGKLKMGKTALKVATVGGVFGAGTIIEEPLIEAVRKCAPKADLTATDISPAEAAGLMAIELFRSSEKA